MTAASDIFPIYQTLNPYHIRTKYENYLAFHVLKYTTCTSFLTSCFLKNPAAKSLRLRGFLSGI